MAGESLPPPPPPPPLFLQSGRSGFWSHCCCVGVGLGHGCPGKPPFCWQVGFGVGVGFWHRGRKNPPNLLQSRFCFGGGVLMVGFGVAYLRVSPMFAGGGNCSTGLPVI